MSLCIIAGSNMTVLAATAFTLTWSHSVERTAWQEDWQLTTGGLEIVEARIKGSGAGMDPPDGSIFENGWWHYKPQLAPLAELRLATSRATEPWQLCTSRACLTIPEADQEAVVIARCPPDPAEASSVPHGD